MIRTALILEDEPLVAEMIKDHLIDLGVQKVYSAQSAIEALDVARNNRPDIAILDITMEYSDDPGHDGIWAAHYIGLGGTPIAFVTAFPGLFDAHNSELSRALGFRPAVVAKPIVGSSALRRVIEKAIANRKRRTKATGHEREAADGIFISYSETDEEWCHWLTCRLKEWARERQVRVWTDRTEIKPGDELRSKIREGIDSSLLAILLLSRSFYSSSFIQDFELPYIEASGIRQIPVIVEDGGSRQADHLRVRLALNRPHKSLKTISALERERLWLGLLEVLDGHFL